MELGVLVPFSFFLFIFVTSLRLLMKVELGVIVPAHLHPYLSDRSYLAPLAPEFDQV